MKKSNLSAVILLLFTVAFVSKSFAQKDQLEKIWYTKENTSKVQMYLTTSGTYAGKIIWLKDPNDKDTGKPKLDKENPDEQKRSTPVLGMVIMTGFRKNPDNKNEYIDGRIYDPKNGKTYCGRITFNGNTLDMRGFLCSITFLGRTETWTLAEGQ
jgi:uncharacterized protein (DUF2147 family)